MLQFRELIFKLNVHFEVGSERHYKYLGILGVGFKSRQRIAFLLLKANSNLLVQFRGAVQSIIITKKLFGKNKTKSDLFHHIYMQHYKMESPVTSPDVSVSRFETRIVAQTKETFKE